MQPMIMLTSAVEGIVSVNGDFWGEARPDAPLFRPVGRTARYIWNFSRWRRAIFRWRGGSRFRRGGRCRVV